MHTHLLFPIIFPKNNFWNTEGVLYEMFRYCEMKPFRRTTVTTAPFLILIIFRFQKIWNTERSLYEKFRYYETRKVDGESWCPPTFFSLTFFDIKRVLKHRRVHLRNVWVLWDKNFQRKIVKPFPLLCMKNFDCKTSETQKGSPTKCFGTVSQKDWGGSWCPPPLFPSTFFNIKNFLKRRRVPLRKVSLLGNKHFRSTVVIPDPFFLQNFLHLEIYLKHRRVP